MVRVYDELDERRIARVSINKINFDRQKPYESRKKYAKENSFQDNPGSPDTSHKYSIRSVLHSRASGRYRMKNNLIFQENRGEGIATIQPYLMANREIATDQRTDAYGQTENAKRFSIQKNL